MTAAQIKPERQAFYDRISDLNLTPLWEVLDALVTPTPTQTCVPALWRYKDCLPFIHESGDLISAMEAVRRVLILENPAIRGQSAITNTLYGGLQLILPGEIAPCHKHTQSALRFIMEGEGAYTAVDGERTIMHPGDLVITPSWTWHDHGHEGDGPMIWFDCLDIPVVNYLNGGFAAEADAHSQPAERPIDDSWNRYGRNMVPVDYTPQTLTSPVFTYPYKQTREVLQTMRQNGAADPCHGYKMKYINPVTGDHITPTISAFMQLIPAGMTTQTYQSTDSTVYIVVEGSGKSTIDGQTFEWGPNDIIAVPSWASQVHEASEDAIVFSYSDRGIHEKLGLWREKRGDA